MFSTAEAAPRLPKNHFWHDIMDPLDRPEALNAQFADSDLGMGRLDQKRRAARSAFLATGWHSCRHGARRLDATSPALVETGDKAADQAAAD